MPEMLPGATVIDTGFRYVLNTAAINEKLRKAQYVLDTQVMNDMEPYMPMDTSIFIQNTRAASAALAGTGKVVAAAPPYGRYLYYGVKMVDSETGRGPFKIPTGPGEYILRFRRGAKLVPTGTPLVFQRAGAQAKWFEVAKAANLQKWISIVQKVIDNG